MPGARAPFLLRRGVSRLLPASPVLTVFRLLDSGTGRPVMRLLRTAVRSEGMTALVAAPDASLPEPAGSALRLEDGRLAEIGVCS